MPESLPLSAELAIGILRDLPCLQVVTRGQHMVNRASDKGTSKLASSNVITDNILAIYIILMKRKN